MALEMKLGDYLIIGVFLAFLVSGVSALFVGFDNSVGITSISDDLDGVQGGISQDMENTESGIQTLVTTDTGFKVEENVFIDERGTAEADFSREKTQSSFKKFISSISENELINSLIHSSIFKFIISTVIFISMILGLRAIFGNGRW